MELAGRVVDAFQPDKFGNSPAHLAALRGHEAVVNFLLEKIEPAQADIILTKRNRQGFSMLHLSLRAFGTEASQRISKAFIERIHTLDVEAQQKSDEKRAEKKQEPKPVPKLLDQAVSDKFGGGETEKCIYQYLIHLNVGCVNDYDPRLLRKFIASPMPALSALVSARQPVALLMAAPNRSHLSSFCHAYLVSKPCLSLISTLILTASLSFLAQTRP